MRDILQEIIATLRTNKLRTALTGFAVSWGIIMIVVLLGAGNGLINAFMSNSEGQTISSMTVYNGRTSIPSGGIPKGKVVRLSDRDATFTESFSEKIDGAFPIYEYSDTASLGKESVSVTVLSNYPEQQTIGYTDKTLVGGRFINRKDIDDCRKVAVIDDKLARTLLEGGGEDGNTFQITMAKTKRKDQDKIQQSRRIIGRHIGIGHLQFLVVGVYEAEDGSWGHDVFIPTTTFRMMRPDATTYRMDIPFHDLKTKEDNELFEEGYKRAFNLFRGFDPADRSTLFIANDYTDNIQMTQAQNVLRIALWVLGIFTLLSGIVGVSNIMLITVRERTHEFGIRKAIGATPISLLKLIVTESVAITTFFGLIGVFLGMAADRVMDATLGSKPIDVGITQIYMFKEIGVGMEVDMEVLVLLIAAGTVAGIVPAWKAAKVRPIEALSKS